MQNLNLYTMDLGYQPFILDIISLLAILSGIMVIITNNPIVSVLFLIALFVNVAGYLILIGVHFVGLSYLLVYVGAVSILFLFILMLINVRISELHSNSINSIPLAFIIGIPFYYLLFKILPSSSASIVSIFNSDVSSSYPAIDLDVNYLTSINSWDGTLAPMSGIGTMGSAMYTTYSMWFILTSIIILLAMVGAIVISLDSSSKTEGFNNEGWLRLPLDENNNNQEGKGTS